MILTKLTFKDLSNEETSRLLKAMRELAIEHELEVVDLDDIVWDELTKTLYKDKKKADKQFNDRVFKIKNNMI